jgi:NADH-quinone oxidoreductase subunit L
VILQRKYYMDDIYQWGIDRVVLVAGAVIGWFDRAVVNDTGVNGSARLGVFAGFELKFLETGKLPNYALAIVGGVIVLAAVFMVVRL